MNNNQVELLLNKIVASEKILLINHIRMDGDALGALGAWYFVLEGLGKTVKGVNDDYIPEDFDFINHNEIINPELNLGEYNPDLIISLDAASIDRLGETYEKNKGIFDNVDFFVIDHHVSNSGFGKYNIIDTQASSTCELSFMIFEKIGFKKYINPLAAQYLYLGIITDTDRFFNANTTAQTFYVASELLKLGADIREPISNLYLQKKFTKIKTWGEILQNTKLLHEGKLACSYIKEKDIEKYDASIEDTSGIINALLSNIKGSEIAILAVEIEKDKTKVSMRSQKYNVAKLCGIYGGGGHVRAAGVTIDKNPKETIELLVQTIAMIYDSKEYLITE